MERFSHQLGDTITASKDFILYLNAKGAAEAVKHTWTAFKVLIMTRLASRSSVNVPSDYY
jgi:hypothetical protein